MKTKVKYLIGAVVAFLTLGAILVIGPLDAFSHGFYCDMAEYEEVEGMQQYTQLQQEPFVQVFSPVKKHFRGFEIVMINLPEDNEGGLLFSVQDESGAIVDETTVNVAEILPGTPYQVYLNRTLKAGRTYALKISAVQCDTVPYLLIADKAYLTQENIEGNLFLGYAYGKPTFSFTEKFLIAAGLLLLYGMLLCLLFCPKSVMVGRSLMLAGLGLLLTWNFLFNTFSRAEINTNSLERYKERTSFAHFQEDSETYVTGVIMAEHNGVTLSPYGLGRYINSVGEIERNDFMTNPAPGFLNTGDYQYGYSVTEPVIVVNANKYTEEACAAGNLAVFPDGESFLIREVSADGGNLMLHLAADKPLAAGRYGSLEKVRFVGPGGRLFQPGELEKYKSQYGLQGRIFRHLARQMEYDTVIEKLHLLCAVLSAAVFMVIVFLLQKKYGTMLAGSFYVTFLLSPWIVNFARNLYWVEFTWFLPMAVGLFCSIQLESRRARIISYAAAYLTVLFKCLCGYEYISTIMMGMILFLLVDWIVTVVRRDRRQVFLIFRTIVLLGIAALAGFMTAILMHAALRGDGSMAAGIQAIWREDVLHRTMGGKLSDFGPEEWNSLQASVWEVFCTYFHFDTQIITGLDGYLFPLLAIAPIVLFVWNGRKYWLSENREQIEVLQRDIALYVVSFCTSISWFILAKSHSQMHTHMNYVLWYFGFVQICIYMIVKQAGGVGKNKL